mgnify:CR=1 FL=1
MGQGRKRKEKTMTQKEKKEPHWFFRIIIGAIITIIVLPFLLYIALQVSKIPQIESRQLNQEGKIATISANLIDLSYKLKKPISPKDIKDMILQIDTISNTKASLIANAEVIEGTGVIPLAEWLSPDQKKKLTVSLQKGHVTQDKEKIATLITATTTAKDNTKWSVDGNRLVAENKSARVAFTPTKKISIEELQEWGTELNRLSNATSQIESPLEKAVVKENKIPKLSVEEGNREVPKL